MHNLCLAPNGFRVVFQKSIPPQIRQLILYISNSEGSVDGFVWDVTSADDLQNTLFGHRLGHAHAERQLKPLTIFERRGNNVQGFQDFIPRTNARIWA